MNKYERLKQDLLARGEGAMKCFGNSMLPILTNPSTCYYRRQEHYDVGDVVFCKVRGRYIDAHKVVAKRGDAYQIANNHGFVNGWTRQVYGRVVRAELKSGRCRDL